MGKEIKETVRYLKSYYEAKIENEKRKVENLREEISNIEDEVIPSLRVDMEASINEISKKQQVGRYRAYVGDDDMYYPDVFTIHFGSVTNVYTTSGYDTCEEFNLLVDSLADIGLSFETEEQAEEYLEKLKAENRS